jgi:hypothetical protein
MLVALIHITDVAKLILGFGLLIGTVCIRVRQWTELLMANFCSAWILGFGWPWGNYSFFISPINVAL